MHKQKRIHESDVDGDEDESEETDKDTQRPPHIEGARITVVR